MKAENRKSNDKLRTEKKKKRSKTVTEQLHKLCQRQCFLLTIFLFFSSIQHLSNGNLSQTVSTPLSQQCFHLLQSLFVLKSVFFSQFFLCEPLCFVSTSNFMATFIPSSSPWLLPCTEFFIFYAFNSQFWEHQLQENGAKPILSKGGGEKIPNVPFHYTSKGTS